MLAFIHVHKTAGTTVEWIMRSSFGSLHYEPRLPGDSAGKTPWETPVTADELALLVEQRPQLQSIGGHRVQPHSGLQSTVPEIHYFTLLRDPLKMRASMYQHGVLALGEENITLEGWLAEEQSQNRQTKMIAGVADPAKALDIIRQHQICVGFTERFDESMLLVKRLLAPSLNILYRRMRVSSTNKIAHDLLDSSRTRAMLAEGNEADQELHRSVMETIYPEQCRQYGDGLVEDLTAYQRKLASYAGQRVSARLMQGGRLSKLALLVDPAPFNRKQLASYLFSDQTGR